MSICTVAVYYNLKYYMHGSLFFSKNTAVHDVLECYMHGSLLFSKNTAVCYILECCMRRQSVFLWKYCRVPYFGMPYTRQFNSVCSFSTAKLLFQRNNRIWQIDPVCKAFSVTPHQTRWHNKRISVKDYSNPLGFLWIENDKLNFPRKYCTKFRIMI